MKELKPMNTLLIVSDNHTKKMIGAYGNNIVKTPNLDSLANTGAKCTNAYTNNPICMPARTALAIGDYASNSCCWDNVSPYDGYIKSFGHRLYEKGHNVVTVGKLHFKDESADTGFNDQRNPLHARNGIGDIFGLVRGFSYDEHSNTFGKYIKEAKWGEAPTLDFDRCTTEEAVKFLLNETGKDGEKPWVLQVGYLAPLFPLVAPEKYKNMYPVESIEMPKQYKIEERPNHPSHTQLRKYMGIEEELDEEIVKNAISVYCGRCSFLDEQIGLLLDALKEADLDQNTRIIYVSDHGDMLGEHGFWFKEMFFEETVSVPLLLNGPDIPAGSIKENVSLIDIYPTIIHGAGIEFSKQDHEKPGTSLWTVAKGEEVLDESRVVISEYFADSISTAMFMVKDSRYKYIYHIDQPHQLYDLKSDPFELEDIAQRKENDEIISRLQGELRKSLDPERTYLKHKESSFEKMEKYGGFAHILQQGPEFSCTPVPDKFLNK